MPRKNIPSQATKLPLIRPKMSKYMEATAFRYSFSTSRVKILPIRLRLYAMNIKPTSELALAIPFLVRI
jgi:hypothetical protein